MRKTKLTSSGFSHFLAWSSWLLTGSLASLCLLSPKSLKKSQSCFLDILSFSGYLQNLANVLRGKRGIYVRTSLSLMECCLLSPMRLAEISFQPSILISQPPELHRALSSVLCVKASSRLASYISGFSCFQSIMPALHNCLKCCLASASSSRQPLLGPMPVLNPCPESAVVCRGENHQELSTYIGPILSSFPQLSDVF